ncbi:MAG: hypothetical protein ABIH89_10850 [Elusimicrobiota bacterium]
MFKSKRLLTGFIVGLLFTVCQSGNAYEKMTLKNLIQLMEGKVNRIERKVTDITMVLTSQELQPGGANTTSRIKFMRRGAKTREVITTEYKGEIKGSEKPFKIKTMAIDDGQNRWQFDPAIFRWIPVFEDDVYVVDIIDLMKWHEDVSDETKILGTERVQDKTLYLVDIPGENDAYTKIWVDKQTLSVVKTENNDMEGNITTEIFSDFKKVKKILDLPHRVEIKRNGELMQILIVNSVKINKGLNDRLFMPPKNSIWDEELAVIYRDMPGEEEIPEEINENELVYPDCEVIKVLDGRSMDSALIIKFSSNAKYKKILKFYKKAFKTNGWNIGGVSEAKYRRSGILAWISAEKDGYTMEVTLAGADKKKDFIQGVITYYVSDHEREE